MMQFHTIHHVAIIASNYDQAKRFYIDILGFDVIREHHDRTDSLRYVHGRKDDVLL
ncbi:VOC family protein [Exiguobacterium sp. SH1S21]|uniref:VOC family protein n=1 Tax=Exiguobacterium sp. SH1S21 TaxID=2510953 RepID=UPI003FA54210